MKLKAITVSAGISAAPYAAKNVKELMENVDLAVYHVKHSGKNGIQVFDTMFRNANKNIVSTNRAHIYQEYESTIYALTAAIDAKDHYTFSHSTNVAYYATALATALGMNEVFDVEEEDNRLILSARELLREKAEEERRAKVSNVEVGLVTEGTVESLQPYGAFVNLGNGLSGLVHISQISEKRIKHPSAVLAVGDKVKVKVIAVKDGKLSLSMKALQDVAAQEIEEEVYELPETEEATTTLGSLFANIKLS